MQDIQEALQALKFGGAMVYPLLVLALLALVISIDKLFVYWRYVRLPQKLLDLVETYGFAWSDLEHDLAALDRNNYFARFFKVILENRAKPAWWVESRAGDEAKLIENSLSRGLWVLETIVTAAPLLGLLGTITGMMHSFQLIGGKGLVDPTGVTGGVAQALIATALGLFIAVTALFAFNYLLQSSDAGCWTRWNVWAHGCWTISVWANTYERKSPMKLHSDHANPKKGRIEIIPMIDVMFFLLATFMLASLSMQNLHSLTVNLPQDMPPPCRPRRR